MIFIVVLILAFASSSAWADETSTPIGGDLGGTKADRIEFFEKYLETATEEQKAIIRDDNPVLKEVRKVFNTTFLTQVNGYLVHRSMLVSVSEDCNRKAHEKADQLLREAFDKTVKCYADFRQRVRSEVDPKIKEFIEIAEDLRISLIPPVDECFEEIKLATMKNFGQNTADHINCWRKVLYAVGHK